MPPIDANVRQLAPAGRTGRGFAIRCRQLHGAAGLKAHGQPRYIRQATRPQVRGSSNLAQTYSAQPHSSYVELNRQKFSFGSAKAGDRALMKSRPPEFHAFFVLDLV